MDTEEKKTQKKVNLEIKKLECEVANLRDDNLTSFEKSIKKRVVPIFLPLLTLTATSLFFIFNRCDSEKSKAFERYKSEVELVKMAWVEMVKDTSKEGNFSTRKAIDFLAKMYETNKKIHIEDEFYTDIPLNQRPIILLSDSYPMLKLKLKNIDLDILKEERKEKGIVAEKDSVKVKNNGEAVAKQKSQNNKEDESIKSTSKDYTIYIQYSDNSNKETVNQLGEKLKYFYIIPGIDYVDSKFNNEIRYYNEFDYKKATELRIKLKEITSLDFDLKNLKRSDIKDKAIEVWYNNKIIDVPSLIKTESKVD